MEHQKPLINSSTGTDPHTAPPTETAIEFKNVSFRYPTRPDIEVLRGLDLKVRKCEKICIVGPSGCGKSTIIALLERFYDITTGELLINGTPISSLDIKAYRSMLGLVPQETTLYQGTIRENLLLGVDGPVTEGQLDAACLDAKIYDFIVSLPEGYDTDCGPRGQAFSGGQRQRIAIARALLRNPEILLLDEATSALDPESENLVRDALDKAARGRTMISVTHQVEAMKNAERIFVMERGRVGEVGRFEELLGRKGRLWEMTLQGELTHSS
jgi:ATP-binding cassette subfamily B (MDR/TAP) protein 1